MGKAGMGKIQHAWTDDKLGFHAKALGQNITGRIDVHDSDLKIEVDLPAFLATFADKISGKLRKASCARRARCCLRKSSPLQSAKHS